MEEDILQTHDAEPDRTPARIGNSRLRYGVVVDVDDAVEHGDGVANGGCQFREIEFTVGEMAAEVDRAEIADGGFCVRGDFGDFRAEVGKMYGVARLAGLVALDVAGVLEDHPAVTGFSEGAHHAGVEIAGFDLALIELAIFGVGIGFFECGAVEVGEGRHVLGIEERPHSVFVGAAHEEVGNPIREIQVVGAACSVAGVVAHFEEGLNVGMPRFEVDAGCAFALAALVDCGD